MKPALKGFLAAPAIPSLLVLALAIVLGHPPDGIWWLTIMLPISYAASALVGLPIHRLLVRFNRRSLIYYAVAGVVASLVPVFFVLMFPTIASHTSQSLLSLYPITGVMALAGGIVASAFWLIARPDRMPDRTTW